MSDQGAIVFGRIEEFTGDRVTGWLSSPTRKVLPVLMVDGRLADLIKWPVARQDVAQELGSTSAAGWEFRVRGSRPGAVVQLFALYDGKLHLVTERTYVGAVAEKDFWRQLERAAEVCAEPDPVAVTVWDGAHNPIGRAKVLYDILDGVRPVVLFSYMMGPFGSTLWQPLADSDAAIVTIPWEGRDLYHSAIRDAGIEFETVWICKPRLPNFHLASVVAAANAGLIIDLDDNDDHFSRSAAAQRKVYGGAGLSQSKMYEARIEARTVASATLRRDYGGEVVRHVRDDKRTVVGGRGAGEGPIKVGFVGTVRPHKNILGAARALAAARWATGMDIEFHVHGDVSPTGLVAEIEDTGAVVGGPVSSGELDDKLAAFDVVLTGFPVADGSAAEVNEYQITSKIGDALALGKPVLVPRTPAVDDLDDVPGIHLFDESTFYQCLRAAAGQAGQVALPWQFTREAGQEAFHAAEVRAQSLPRASSVFADMVATRRRGASHPGSRNLLLLWKQHDSGLYGRRVDQVARAYKRANPDCTVRVLELMHEVDLRQYRERVENDLSDAAHIVAMSDRKRHGGHVDEDGVIRDQVTFGVDATSGAEVFSYLTRNGVMPWNTVAVLFPHHRTYPHLREVLAPYVTVVDVVDNHFSWASQNAQRQANVALQYHELVGGASRVVFNSERNREFFLERGIVPPDKQVDVVANWYAPPLTAGSDAPPTASGDGMFDVVYSGNMNDRIDWDCLRAVLDLGEEIRLHLIGGADRAPTAFRELLGSANVIYHGPQSETYSLEILRRSHLALMPHSSNLISEFMNPLKLYMYEAVGVPVVATAVEGIGSGIADVTVVPSRSAFVETVRTAYAAWVDGGRRETLREGPVAAGGAGEEYVSLLDETFDEIAVGSSLGALSHFRARVAAM